MSGDASMEVDESIKKKGRGFVDQAGDGNIFDSTLSWYNEIEAAGKVDSERAGRSVEGWIVMVTGVHEEASEEDVQDFFAEFGDIKNIHLNLDRRTGYVKGYALVEYNSKAEALRAIDESKGAKILEQEIKCDFAFIRPPQNADSRNKLQNSKRSQSPERA